MTTKNKTQINIRKKKKEKKNNTVNTVQQHRPTRRTAVFKQPNRQPSTPSSNNPFNHIQTTHFKQPISNNPFQTTHYKNPLNQPITKTHSNRENGSVQTTQRGPVDTLTFYEFFRLWHFVHRCPKGCHSIFGLLRRFFFFACRRPFDR